MGTVLPAIIGLPPLFEDNEGNINDKMIDSMPTALIQPAYPNFSGGMSTMNVSTREGKAKYNVLLNAHNFSLYNPKEGLRVAYLADAFPTDSFSNSYTEGFLQEISNGIGKKASTLMQTFGGDSGLDALSRVTKSMSNGANSLGGIGTAIGGALGGFSGMARRADRSIKNHSATGNDMANSIAGNLNALAAGARVDFPQIWSDSQFAPSYTMTIRLFNPEPSNPASTEKYIIGPIAALLLLGVPISADGNSSTYNYPFLHDIKSPGIYHLNPCFISNIAIIKGGDQQQIAYNQQMGIVDVRLDFGSLFNSMLASNDKKVKDRPTLYSYLDSFRNEKTLLHKDPKTTKGDHGDAITIDDVIDKIENAIVGDTIDIFGLTDLYKKAIGISGSLSQALKNGLAIPEYMAKSLLKDGLVGLQDYLNSFPKTIMSDLLNELGGIAKVLVGDFVSNLNINQLKGLGTSLIGGLKGLTNIIDKPFGTLMGMSQTVLGAVSNAAGFGSMSIGKIMNTSGSLFGTIQNTLTNGVSFSLDTVHDLFGGVSGMVGKLGIGLDSVLDMGSGLIGNILPSIGTKMTEVQCVESVGSILSSLDNGLNNGLTPKEGLTLLSKLDTEIDDFSKISDNDLIKKIAAIGGDTIAGLDLAKKVKALSISNGMSGNDMLLSSIGIISGIETTATSTGINTRKIVSGGIEIFKHTKDISMQGTLDLFDSIKQSANDESVDRASVLNAGLHMFDEYSKMQNDNDLTTEDVLKTATGMFDEIKRSATELGVSEDEALKSGKQMLKNLGEMSDDPDPDVITEILTA